MTAVRRKRDRARFVAEDRKIATKVVEDAVWAAKARLDRRGAIEALGWAAWIAACGVAILAAYWIPRLAVGP